MILSNAAKTSLATLLFIICLFVIHPAPALAQGSVLQTLHMQDSNLVYPLVPHTYVIKDWQNKHTFRSVVDELSVNNYNYEQGSKTLSIAGDGIAYWYVFPVKNYSDNDLWLFSLGEAFSERMGFLHQAKIIVLSNNMYRYNNVSALAYSMSMMTDIGNEPVPIQIRKGEERRIVLYIESHQAVPFRFAPSIQSFEYYNDKNIISFDLKIILYTLLFLSAGFSLGIFILRRSYTAIAVFCYAVLNSFFLALMDYIVVASAEVYANVPAVIMCFVALLGLLMTTGLYESIRRLRGYKAVLSALVLLTIMSLLVVITSPASGVFFLLCGYFLPLCMMLAMTLMAMFWTHDDLIGSTAYAVTWLLVLFGFISSYLSTLGTLPPYPILTQAYWLLSAAQVCTVLYLLIRKDIVLRRLQTVQIANREHELKRLVHRYKNKDGNEAQALREQIEDERQKMEDLKQQEKIRADEMQEAIDEADRANSAKSAFLAIVSHEIRTPMTGIMGMVRLLLDSKLTKEQHDYAQTIKDSSDAMLALLNDILDFEKIESGRLDLDYIDFDLHRLANGVTTLMSGHAESKNVSLSLSIAKDVPQFIIGDPVRLRQILLNLVGNAIKFTDDGDVTVTIAKDPLKRASNPEAHFISFMIEDSGIGISKEAQDKLFSPFVQANRGITRQYGGSGLGLVICKLLIEAMGSEIGVDSTEGHGSKFFFTLNVKEGRSEQTSTGLFDEEDKALTPPSEKGDEDGDSDRAQQDAGASKDKQGAQDLSSKDPDELNLMIVEDNQINQKLFKELVSRLGYDPDQAMSGEEALEKLEEKKYDIILMDIEMPGMGGVKATRMIRNLPDTDKASVPIIALTANVDQKDIDSYYAANMNEALQKPLDPFRLKKVIAKIVEGDLNVPVELGGPIDVEEDQADDKNNEDDKSGDGRDENQTGGDAAGGGAGMSKTTSTSTPASPHTSISTSSAPASAENSQQTSTPPNTGGVQREEQKPYVPVPPQEAGAQEPYVPVPPQDAPPQETSQPRPQSSPAASSQIADDSKMGGAMNDMVVKQSASGAEENAAGTEEQDVKTLNVAVLKDLKSNIPLSDLEDLIESVFTQTQDSLAQAEKHLQAGNMEDFRSRLHELRGMAGNFGMNAIQSYTKDIENALKGDGDPKDYPAMVDKIKSVIDETKAAIEKWLQDETS